MGFLDWIRASGAQREKLRAATDAAHRAPVPPPKTAANASPPVTPQDVRVVETQPATTAASAPAAPSPRDANRRGR